MGPVRTNWEGAYLDGRTPVRRRAAVRLLRRGLEITLEDGQVLRWPYAELRQTQGAHPGEEVRLERGGPLPESLLVGAPGFLASLRRIGREEAHGFRGPAPRGRRLLWAGLSVLGSVGAAGALYLWAIPLAADRLALHVPVAWEERLGRSVADQLAPPARQCREPQGLAAVEEIVQALARPGAGDGYTIRVRVADNPSVNALAAPGGHIVIFRGLLERSRTPEELAGVLAHEIQHVVRRDVTRAILRHASGGLLLAALTGDPTGLMGFGLEAAHALVALQYSRQAELEADEEGLRLLVAAGLDPAGMLAFFEQLLQEERRGPQLPPYLSTHPGTLDRLVRLRALARQAPPPTVRLLPGRDWTTLRRMCQAAPAGSAPPAGP